MDCIFCKILKKEIPAGFIYRGEKVSVFKDIHPKAPVHVLIVPERHIESIDQLTEEDREVIAEMLMVAKKTAQDLGVAGGYKLLINVGKKGGQLVDHLHMHLMGGWPEKEIDIEVAERFKDDLTSLLK